MNQRSAIILMPDDTVKTGEQTPLMLQNVLGTPLLKWLTESLAQQGVVRFFLAAPDKYCDDAAGCFPKDAKLSVAGGEDPADLLHVFLSTSEGPEPEVLAITGPVVFAPSLAARDPGKAPMQAPACLVPRLGLMSALDEGRSIGQFLQQESETCTDREGFYAVTSAAELPRWGQSLRQLQPAYLRSRGVEIWDYQSCYVAPGIPVGVGSVLLPGTILEGEGTEDIRELMDAISLRITRQTGNGEKRVRLRLMSGKEEALSLAAEESTDGQFAIVCSLLGDNMLVCQRNQFASFLETLVQVLADLKLLNSDAQEKMNALANQAAGLLETYLEMEEDTGPQAGLNPQNYYHLIERMASSSEERMLETPDESCPDAVKVQTFLINEENRKKLVDLALKKAGGIPVVGDQLKSGNLRIGNQRITDTFIRELFDQMDGDILLEIYEDAEGTIVRMDVHTPDISELVTDPEFASIRGITILIRREETSEGRVSETDLNVIGLDGSLMSIRVEETAGSAVPALSARKVHSVGEMDSAELWDLIRSMGFTITGNAMNMLLTLPRCVFDLVVGKILGR